jgi:hypothetical protein
VKKVKTILVFSFLLVIIGCGVAKKLVYKENWEGDYILIEYNCCGDTATKVKMKINKIVDEKYSWQLYLNNNITDTIFGEAFYKKKKLKFFVSNIETATKYFIKNVAINDAVFVMESEQNDSYYTWWYNDLRNYKTGKMLFSGINYHFKMGNRR